MRSTTRRIRRARGQGLTEYLIILALVAIALIVTVNDFGKRLYRIWHGSQQPLQSVEEAVGGGSSSQPPVGG